jgi:hypothetical protein
MYLLIGSVIGCCEGWKDWRKDNHMEQENDADSSANDNDVIPSKDGELYVSQATSRPDGITFDKDSNTYVAKHTIITAGETEADATLALAEAVKLTAEYWPPREAVDPLRGSR